MNNRVWKDYRDLHQALEHAERDGIDPRRAQGIEFGKVGQRTYWWLRAMETPIFAPTGEIVDNGKPASSIAELRSALAAEPRPE